MDATGRLAVPVLSQIGQQAQEWFDILTQGYQRCREIDEAPEIKLLLHIRKVAPSA